MNDPFSCSLLIIIFTVFPVAVQRINIERFLALAHTNPVADVRSPCEYLHAHIPGAVNMPLFTDEERKVVGTAYKQQSRETAIKIGLDFFGEKMREIVEETEKLFASGSDKINKTAPQTILINCLRGGMRSAGVAWLLDLYGFKVYLLAGGYKAYRKYVLQQFEKERAFHILGGYTGSGKTLLLHALQREGFKIIDLEALANHKGSALGGLGQKAQPKQEMFENLLAQALSSATGNDATTPVFLEDESQRIGNMQIPMPLWSTMRQSPVWFMDIGFEERLNYLTEEYRIHPKEQLINAVIRIQKRLGGLETKNAVNFLLEENYKECFRILLMYYDKWYTKGLYNRKNAEALIVKISAGDVNIEKNIQIIKRHIKQATQLRTT